MPSDPTEAHKERAHTLLDIIEQWTPHDLPAHRFQYILTTLSEVAAEAHAAGKATGVVEGMERAAKIAREYHRWLGSADCACPRTKEWIADAIREAAK